MQLLIGDGFNANGEKETPTAVPDDQFAFLKSDSSECRRRVEDAKGGKLTDEMTTKARRRSGLIDPDRRRERLFRCDLLGAGT